MLSFRFATFALILSAFSARPAVGDPSSKQLSIATAQEFETLNPIIMSMSASWYISFMVDRPVATIDADWKWTCLLCAQLPSLENGLAKVVEEAGKKKISVDWRLKDGLKWGDGKPVTGKDFALAIEIGKSQNVQVPSRDNYDRIDRVVLDPKDPLKFTTVFKEPRYDFYQMPIFPLPSHIEGPIWEKTKGTAGAYEKQTAYTTDPTNPGLYDGPYILTEIKLGSHVVVKKNPNWAGGKPAQIEKVIVKLIPNTQTLEAALLSGEIDMVNELGMTFDQAVDFEKRLAKSPAQKSKYRVEFRDGLTYEHVDLNLRNPIFQDKNVRKALVYGLDRRKLTQALFAGKQAPAIEFFHPLDVYYTENVVKYDYDPKRAVELLNNAGWKVGPDGTRVKSGQKLTLNLMTTAGNKSRELVEQFMQQEFKKIGIAVDIKNEPARVFFGETTVHAEFPAMAMYAWQSSPDSPPKEIMHSSEIPTKENSWAGENYGGWKNARADKLLDDVYVEFDLEKRKHLMAELMGIYTDEVPVIPLYLRADIVVVPTKLANFRITGHQYQSSENIEAWSIEPQAH